MLPTNSVSLVVTSPPFLDVVQYADDNWLRCWFLDIEPDAVQLTVSKQLDAWAVAMTKGFRELHRVLQPGGHIAFEVGEVRGGKIKLEETVLSCGSVAGLEPVLVLINDQQFTKTANCRGVNNNEKGTNTNRVVVFQKLTTTMMITADRLAAEVLKEEQHRGETPHNNTSNNANPSNI